MQRSDAFQTFVHFHKQVENLTEHKIKKFSNQTMPYNTKNSLPILMNLVSHMDSPARILILKTTLLKDVFVMLLNQG